MTEHVAIELSERIQTLRLDRPQKKNAITGAMYEAMAAALADGERSADVAVHVIAGRPGVFTAGNDIGEFLAYAEGGALGPSVLAFLRSLVGLGKPLIAAVDGLCIGVGTTLLLHCDLVYASPASVFRTPFLDLGLVPEAGSSLLMPMRMGHARAFEMICLGETFDAERAREAGLVNRIVAAEAVEPTAREAARRLAAKPPAALAAARRLVRGDPAAILERMDREVTVFSERLRSAEAKEAFAAFLEKRPPDFGHRGKA
jgi:enoyl-CoA hydratase/carnithine racemase